MSDWRKLSCVGGCWSDSFTRSGGFTQHICVLLLAHTGVHKAALGVFDFEA